MSGTKAVVWDIKAVNSDIKPVKVGHYLQKGDSERAVADFTAAIDADPVHARAYSLRARANISRRKFQDAVADFDDAIRLGATGVDIHLQRAYDLSRAIEDYTVAIGLDPRLAVAYEGRGVVYVETGQFEKAVSDYSEAIRLDPKPANRYYGRGVASLAMSQYPNAISDFSEAIRLNPKYAEAYFARGRAFQKKGETARAHADFAEAARLGYKPLPEDLNRRTARP